MGLRRLTRMVGIALAAGAVLAVGVAAPADARVRRDPCLRGQWNLGSAQSLDLLNAMVEGLPGFVVTEGTITMTFGGGRMKYGSTLFLLSGDLGDQTFTAEASFLTDVPYRTRPDLIVTGPGDYELSFGTMTGTKDGRTYTAPGPPGITEPVGGGATPYVCTRTTLRYAVPTADGNATMATFRRA